MKNKIFRSIGFKIIFLYVLLSFLNISFVVSIIFENQVDLISKNMGLESEKQLSSLVDSIKKFTLEMKKGTLFNIKNDRDTMTRIKNLITPHVTDYLIFTENGEVFEKSRPDFEPPKTYIQDGLRSMTAVTFTGKEYYVRIDEPNKMLYFYVPLQLFQSSNTILLIRKDISGINESLKNLYHQAIFVIIVVLLFHAIFALFLYRYIIQPITIINREGLKLIKGDLGVRVKLDRNDDFGSLAETFNRMAESMGKNITAISHEMEIIKERKEKIKKMSLRDELTGLFNRLYMTERIHEEIRIAAVKKRGIAFLLIDMDHVENINSIYGFQTGDIILKEVAKSITQTCDGIGTISRFEGEQFAVLCPEQSREGIGNLAERIRSGIEKKRIITPDGELSATVSIGISFFDREQIESMNYTAENITEAANSALARAKSHGRNRVEIFQ